MKLSTDRILTTHVGSLPRPDDLFDLMLDRMEDGLGRHAWLVGDKYSLADISVVPFVKRIDEEIAPDEVSDKKHPRLLAWWQRVQARPAFAEARIGPFV